MTKVTMPKPAAWMLAVQTMGGDIGWKLSWSQSGAGICHRLSGELNEKPLITAAQAETYADARVTEALEAAAHIIETNASGCNETTFYVLHSQIAAIRALIPNK